MRVVRLAEGPHTGCTAGKELEGRVEIDRATNARLPQLLTVQFSYSGIGATIFITLHRHAALVKYRMMRATGLATKRSI